jgi:hypothetical protein
MTTSDTTNQQTDPRAQAHIMTFITTEHYNLQSGRASTISDANGRSSLFLTTVSTSLVALAFIGQVSQLGTEFYIFALILFPALLFLGLVTFERVLQTAIEDIVYARGINRIRHFYQEIAPEMAPYFVMSAHDDDRSVYGNMSVRQSLWQVFLTTSGMIAVIDSILAGVFAGLVAGKFAHVSLTVSVLTGAGLFLVVLAILFRYQWMKWGGIMQGMPTLFPTPIKGDGVAQ